MKNLDLREMSQSYPRTRNRSNRGSSPRTRAVRDIVARAKSGRGRGNIDLKRTYGKMGVDSKFNIVHCSKEPFSLWSKNEAISLDIKMAIFQTVPVYF
jgi:hypothetical protein